MHPMPMTGDQYLLTECIHTERIWVGEEATDFPKYIRPPES